MTFPNQLSILRIVLSPVFCFLFLSDNLTFKRLSILIYFIATLTDWYDGWHARKFKSVTRLGIFIDPLADKILTSFSFALFAVLGIVPWWMVILIISRDLIITLLRSYREMKGIYFKTSFIAKVKTFIQMTYIFIVLIILLALTFDMDIMLRQKLSDFLSVTNPLNFALMSVVTFLTVFTGISYFFEKKPLS